MILDKRILLNCNNGYIGVTHSGISRIGHKRRCPVVTVEPPVCLNDGIELETSFLGMGTYIGKDTVIKQTEFIGRFATIGEHCYIGAANQECVGISNSMVFMDNNISWYKKFLKISHPYDNKKKLKTKIGNDVWIGDNVTIFRGVNVGDGVVILSGAAVATDIPPYAIVSGNPGVIIGYRFERETITQLLKLGWWHYGIDAYKDIKLNEMSAQDIITHLQQYESKAVKKKYGQCNFKFIWDSGRWSICYEEAGQKDVQHIVPEI